MLVVTPGPFVAIETKGVVTLPIILVFCYVVTRIQCGLFLTSSISGQHCFSLSEEADSFLGGLLNLCFFFVCIMKYYLYLRDALHVS